jgi:serine/threonine-protein kinase
VSERIGTTLGGKYRILRLLGEGGMGEVYQAEHVKLKRRVAVKVMRPGLSANPEAMERFVREAQAASAIGHPNIVDIQDIGEEPDGSCYLVMELLHGQPLDHLLAKSGGRLPVQRALGILLQILSALVATHKKNITHRDLKPENVFLATDARGREEVKLLDFGASKFSVKGEDRLRLTQTGAIIGTPMYLAPEQARGAKEVDHRVDIWGAGTVFYELVTGQPPYRADSYNELIGNILLNPIAPLRSLAPEVSRGLAAAIEKALKKDPEDRYQTAAKMIEALLPYYQHEPGHDMSAAAIQVLHSSIAPPGTASEPAFQEKDEEQGPSVTRRRLVLPVGLGGVFIALAAAAVAVFTFEEQPTPQPLPLVAPLQWPVPPPAAQPPATLPSLALPASTTVKLDISGLVPGATVTIDGKPVSLPTEVVKSNKDLVVEIRARGYATHTSLVRPDQDQSIRVSLRRHSSPEVKPASKAGGRPGKQGGSAEDIFAENPFE